MRSRENIQFGVQSHALGCPYFGPNSMSSQPVGQKSRCAAATAATLMPAQLFLPRKSDISRLRRPHDRDGRLKHAL